MFSTRTNWDLTPNALSVALAERRAAGKPVIDLTASNPTECGFLYQEETVLAALANPAGMRYEPDPRGLLKAREAVCEYYAARGDGVSAESVLLTTTTSEAYSFAFRLLCNAGDEVLVPQPSYPLFDFLAELQDVRLVRYPLLYDHGWQIDFHGLRQALTERSRAIIAVNPNNPTGNLCAAQEMAQLNEICAARGMAIIADQVFLDYSLKEVLPCSFATNAGALTLTMSGLSKVAALPQMKAAWLVTSGPEAAKREALARLEVIADTFLSMNAPVQHAMAEFLRLRGPVQAQIMARVRSNLSEVDRQLASGTGKGQGSWTRLEVDGGWYAVLRMSSTIDSGELALRLLNADGVYVHPGHFYEMPGSSHVVVSLITPEAEFAKGVSRLLVAESPA